MKTFFRQRIKKIVSLFFLFITMIPAQAQQNKMDIAGVYLLTGVMETACVFELKKDSSFEFLFSQGALDRSGTGTWRINNGYIVFNSIHARPPKDYTLVSSKAIPGNFTVVKMVNKNTMILPYSDVTLITPAGQLQQSTDSHGEARFSKKQATTISLLFTPCPDRPSVFSVDPKQNYFEFRLESWVAEVFFKDFGLQLNNGELNGANPVLEGNKFRYVKQAQ
jgi:hypothetical protein